MVKNIFNNDPSVRFEEKDHRYFNRVDKELKSVSRVIEGVKTPFDAQKMSSLMAPGDQKKQQEILAEWERAKDSSIVRGNWIHDELEQYSLVGKYDPKLKDVVRQLQPIFKSGYKYYTEALTHSMEYMVAGQSDLVVQRQKNEHPVFDFYDYKTNESKGIEFDSIAWKKTPPKHYNRYMLPPFDHLEDCNYIHYSLQLSIYAYMSAITWGCRIGKLAILYIDNDLKLNTYPVPYMKLEAETLLKYNLSLKPLPEMAKPMFDNEDDLLNW